MKYAQRKNLCLVYNFAQHYRTNIFKIMDREMHCDFVFGDKYLDIKKMDYSLLTNVLELKNVHLIGDWYYQKGALSLVKKYKSLLMLGDVHCVSTWMIAFIARFFGTKVYFWSHAWYGKESFLVSVLKKCLYKNAKGMFLYGNYAKSLMVKEGFKEDKLHVIYNSLDYDDQIKQRNSLKESDIYKQHFCNAYKNIFFVGRLTSIKRLDMLIDSVNILRKKNIMVNLTLIGDGIERETLKNQVHNLGLDKNVWFYGPCYDEKLLSELIFNADLCVSPGNVGLTAMHSMVFGTPVITHDNFPYQMPEFEAIQDGITGRFYKYGDLMSLSESIISWLNMNRSREKIRQDCFNVIDSKYNPYYQIKVLKKFIE